MATGAFSMSKIALEPNASGTGTFTIASPNSNTSRTLTLPDADGALLTDGSSLDAGNLTGTLPAIDGSALTGMSSGGMTLLGTLSTSSGTSVTLSGLDLTGYVFLCVIGDGVSSTNTYEHLETNGRRLFQITAGGESTTTYGRAFLDLSTQQSLGVSSTNTANTWYGGTGITSASTSITLHPTSGSFDAGSIRIYGVA